MVLRDSDDRLAVIECPDESAVDRDMLMKPAAFVAEMVASVE
jgi:hypothetical protein